MKKQVKSITIAMAVLIVTLLTNLEPMNVFAESVPSGYIPIYTIDDLYGINDNLSGNYILMNDIDLSETVPGGAWDSGSGWTPIGVNTTSETFSGIFDGNRHKISNMTIYNSENSRGWGGLFFRVGGTVHSLGLEEINITNVDAAGGIAAELMGKITDCYVTGSIDNESVNGSAGGIACEVSSAQIIDCYTDVDLAGAEVGGIAGHLDYADDPFFENCYVIGALDNNGNDSEYVRATNSGAIAAGTIFMDSVKNCYYLSSLNCESTYGKKLTATQMKSAKCYTGFDFKNTWVIDTNSSYPFPQLKSCMQVEVSSVELLAAPKKLQYTSAEKLDFTGSKLKISYDDGFSNTVELTEDMVSYEMEPGTQTVTIDYFGQTDEFEISVTKPKESLSVKAKKNKLKVGQVYTYKVKYVGSGRVSFQSTKPSLLKINKSTGKAVARKKGKTTIIIKAGNLSKKIKVTVV